MSDLPPCKTCGAYSDQFKVSLWSFLPRADLRFICTECGATTVIDDE